ncbi:MAG: hypothetical protein LBF40_00485 [Deltaproteobacteria bacterium]|jgi:Sec-independent protein translocase protein TatA|nr:hypothetical protein [Deltaproteobacteria bacterium]
MAPGIGWTEIAFIVLVMLVVIRPDNLPGAIRAFARQYRRIREFMAGARAAIGKELDKIENAEAIKEIKGVAKIEGIGSLGKEMSGLKRELQGLSDPESPEPAGQPDDGSSVYPELMGDAQKADKADPKEDAEAAAEADAGTEDAEKAAGVPAPDGPGDAEAAKAVEIKAEEAKAEKTKADNPDTSGGS